MDVILFYLLGAVAIAASVLVVGQRHPMYSVLLLIVSFMALAGLYVLLDAPFLAVTQIIIYGGAIMVLFLFVVMLLNVPREDPARRFGGAGVRRFGVALAVALAIELAWAVRRMGAMTPRGELPDMSSVRLIGQVLFTDYRFAFEATSVLILVALVGAIVMARKES